MLHRAPQLCSEAEGPSVPLRGGRPVSSAQRQTFCALVTGPRSGWQGRPQPQRHPRAPALPPPQPPQHQPGPPRAQLWGEKPSVLLSTVSSILPTPGVLGTPLQPMSLRVPRVMGSTPRPASRLIHRGCVSSTCARVSLQQTPGDTRRAPAASPETLSRPGLRALRVLSRDHWG